MDLPHSNNTMQRPHPPNPRLQIPQGQSDDPTSATEFPQGARLAHINNQIAEYARKLWDQEKGPASIQGMGSYTHIQSNTSAAQLPENSSKPLLPYQRYMKKEPTVEFLPLDGGIQEPRGSSAKPARESLPANVKAAYEALKRVIEAEARNSGAPRDVLPIEPIVSHTTMPSLGMDPPPPPLALSEWERRGSGARRSSGDVAMGGTGTATGTYDASRDPRRRGR
ncbi:hypothetical protein BCR34DRAFT_558896 [Clohesyomyces aquaticus]|uniref:Uncharacterized protein n=1 Tax=Clohesyomyces aquaticus TaxID=1231657 RepID=A0A1Y1ZZ14_9PLEO|nr:hypothetical protein BCR34DRAFT_558896 [Clohesyomyces aquaticus]